jgi:hypothetical protein
VGALLAAAAEAADQARVQMQDGTVDGLQKVHDRCVDHVAFAEQHERAVDRRDRIGAGCCAVSYGATRQVYQLDRACVDPHGGWIHIERRCGK